MRNKNNQGNIRSLTGLQPRVSTAAKARLKMLSFLSRITYIEMAITNLIEASIILILIDIIRLVFV